ncbi:MAG TPA: sugar phosphate isomerase/epimerase [Opitutaceae bacterium]
MKALLLTLLTAASACASTVADHLGLQMYSLRAMAAKDGWRSAMDQAKAFGFTYIEGSGPPKGITMEAFKADQAALGLTEISAGVDYGSLGKDLAGEVSLVKSLGCKYAMIAWIPHSDKDGFNEAEAKKAIEDFNTWGAAFKAEGISLVYHAHGYEFRPLANGDTLFDMIARETNPEFINFEMDVFWITHGGQDPAKLLAKYPDRWKMMHVKDIRKGAPTGLYTGHAPATDDVAVGSGQVDWPSVLKEAQAVGVQWYFIEDESETPLENIPKSVAYIKSLGL